MSALHLAPGWAINVCIGTKHASRALLWSPPRSPGGRGGGLPAIAVGSQRLAGHGTGRKVFLVFSGRTRS